MLKLKDNVQFNTTGNAATASKVNNTLTLTKGGTNTVFDGSATKTVTIPTIYTGSGTPASSLGQNGDIYIVTG